MRAELTQAPAAEPISLSEAKAHLRVSVTDDDTLITALIVSARQAAESLTGRRLVTQRWKALFDSFADTLRLSGLTPISSIVSANYVDENGATQSLTLSLAQIVKSEPAEIVLAYGESWPAVRAQPEAVSFTVEVGYGGAAAVPQAIKQWMLLQIGAMYANREAAAERPALPLQFADGLIDPYRVMEL